MSPSSPSARPPAPSLIKAVGHVALRVTDLHRAVEHATTVLGMREAQRTDGVAYLTCDTHHHSVEYIEADEVALDHVGLEAHGDEAFAAIRAALAERSIACVEVTEPGIAQAIRFEGPAGHVFEVYPRMDRGEPRTYATTGVRPLRMGHVTLKAEVVQPTVDFAVGVLGFTVSDSVVDGLGTWMRCNEAHHSLTVMQGGDGIHHYAFDVEHIGEIQRVCDALAENGHRLVYGPGRHGVGENIFIYSEDPHGVIVEHLCGLERIDDAADRPPRVWSDDPDFENLWGPMPADPGFNGRWTPLMALRDASRA